MNKTIVRQVCLWTLALCSLRAQTSAGLGNINGVVQDASGSVVPNAKVVILNAAKGVHRELQTNGAGLFTAPSLVPAAGYQVTVTANGFNQNEQKDIELRVGQSLNLAINLQIGQSATQVEVTSASELLDDTKNDVSQAVGDFQISNLPINGRRVDSFVLLTPGVTNDATFGLVTFRGVAGNNNFLLDGNDNTEQFYDENAGRTRMVSQVSQDAVQEFQVVSSNYSAEYGRAMGGVVNTITKSGSNGFHGSAFYYFRSTGFDARDPFASFNPTEHRVQVGGTVGGSIIKDKLFYFVSTDITRRNFPMVDSQVKAGIIDPNSPVWLGCAAPATAAQCQAINGLLPRFFGAVPRTAANDLYFGRMDYRYNDKNTFSASFNYLRWKSPNGIQTGLVSTSGAAINGNGDDSVRVRNGKLTGTAVPSSNFVNEFRFGWFTDRQADDPDQALLGQGLGLLNVNVAGVSLGPANYVPRVEPNEQRFQFVDDATWTKGRHTIKAGFDFASTEDKSFYLPNLFGTYTYNTVTAFAQDYTGNTGAAKNWTSYSQAFGNPGLDSHIKEVAAYLNDQWRFNDRLTVNLGARYERSFVEQPKIVNPDWPQTSNIPVGSLNLAPRIGASFKIDDKTVIRGGFGLFFARFLGGLQFNLWANNGVYTVSDSLSSSNTSQLAAGPLFPNNLTAPPTGASVAASTIQYASPNLKTPYSEQGSIAVERQLGKSMALTVSGIWSHGVNLYGVQDVNLPALSNTYTYKIADANGNQTGTFTTPVYAGTRPNTKYGSVLEDTNGVSSYYAGLAVTLEKRYSHGLQSLLSYTWSHEIDDGQGAGSSAIFFSSASNWTYNGNYAFDKGSGSLDQRHRLVHSFVYTPPSLKHNDFFTKYVINNWQMSAITTLSSGRPAGSPTIRFTDTAATAPVTGMISLSSIDGLGANSRVPFLPVNSLYTDAAYRADLRVTKIVPVGENRKLYLNAEVFNISNSWSPTSESTQVYQEAKGVLTLTPTAYGVGSADGGFPDGTQARRIQISARFIW